MAILLKAEKCLPDNILSSIWARLSSTGNPSGKANAGGVGRIADLEENGHVGRADVLRCGCEVNKCYEALGHLSEEL